MGIKTTSKENKIMYSLRSCYYKIIKKMSKVDQIEHFTGFGPYDKNFIEILRDLKDSTPFLRGIVAELGYKRKEIPYEQQKRKADKSSFSLYALYDAAMLGEYILSINERVMNRPLIIEEERFNFIEDGEVSDEFEIL